MNENDTRTADKIAASIGRSWMAQRLHDKGRRAADSLLISKLRASGTNDSILDAVNTWNEDRSKVGANITDESITAALLALGRRR